MKKVVLLSATVLAGIALVGCGKTSSSSSTDSATSSEMTEQYTKAEYAVMAYMKTGDISAKDLKKDADKLTLKHKGNKYTITNDVQSFVCEVSGNKVKVTLQDADGKKLSTVSYTKKALAKSYQNDLEAIDRVIAKLQGKKDESSSSFSSSSSEASSDTSSSQASSSASSSKASSSNQGSTSSRSGNNTSATTRSSSRTRGNSGGSTGGYSNGGGYNYNGYSNGGGASAGGTTQAPTDNNSTNGTDAPVDDIGTDAPVD